MFGAMLGATAFGATAFGAMLGAMLGATAFAFGALDNKLCLHVGHVLFMRNHCAKPSGLNMWPQCRMRATCWLGSNTSWVIEHTLFIGLGMFLNAVC